ncbi:SH2 domain-containing adapter protein F-like isoform X3 [Scleropages formosus]|uniref:Src homology 2 domain containing F n=1 Tax=Scleropages formosus TaxID=113540 RepID=A0A8C9TM62_SCLFO|nr:SH2 domain-containing adapter protein F-like isoform X3 [Scleropages formosus]
MAKWFKEHLGFKTSKAPPPAPPKPDYRHCHPAVPGAPGFQAPGSSAGAPALYPSPAQPDILAAYKLQKELDFEDPYTGAGNAAFCGGLGSAGGAGGSSSSELKYVSPKHRLIKVETVEKSSPALAPAPAPAPSPAAGPSPPAPAAAEQDAKQEKLIILEDYADPFDAEQAGGTQAPAEKVPENDGYMEPYEAQKMMAEIRGVRGPKDGPLRQLPLYDTPYEPTEDGGEPEPEPPRCPRESRLPQDDERPPEEYDQPWEWKKDRISKAFAVEIKVIKDLPWPPPVGQLDSAPPLVEEVEAPGAPAQAVPAQPPSSPGQTACDQHHPVQFEGLEKSRMSPTKEGKVRPPQRHSSGCLVNTKLGSLDHCNVAVGERIDPSMPLESQFWYHGAISRIDAESLLRLCKEASYLVRNSETSKNDFSLSLKSSQGFMHMKLSRTKDNKYILGQNSGPFDSVPEIIHFYSSRKLPIKGAEHMSLLYPVAIRTL